MLNEKQYTFRMQWLVFICSGLVILLLIGNVIDERTHREWKKYQREFRKLQDPSVPFQTGILQVDLPRLNRTDRCITCHNGLEDKDFSDAPQPFTAHPGTYLLHHPVQKYGCTICHGGQGRALNKKDAFGQAPETHWSHPLLNPPYIQSSCGKCHLTIYQNSDRTVEGDQPAEEISSGMGFFLRGQEIFSREGCLGCHKARGVGGIIGPDLTEQGEKTRHEYSFQNITGEQTISNWLKEHFKDPEMVSPGSQMLKINLPDEDLSALATFVMGLAKPDIPFEYFSLVTLNEFKGVRDPIPGGSGYAFMCSACHGKEGEGKGYKEYETGVPSIMNRQFLQVASREFIRFTLEKGRSKRQMASWQPGISGLSGNELDGITGFIRERAEPGPERVQDIHRGSAERGEQVYKENCAMCHGRNGEGDVAVALNQEGLLERADDLFLIRTILLGRNNTAMPSWYNLEDEQVGDLLAYLRTWYPGSRISPPMNLPPGEVEKGKLQYHFLCSRCHGEFGEGETGPSVINRKFLRVADDRFLYETIAEGRIHTAMFGWSRDVFNAEKLVVQDISDIIAFMRSASHDSLTYIHAGSNPGNRESGSGIFRERCSECHGINGEGIFAPALNNQEFLNAASNGYLMATMSLGRDGTKMPSWGRGDTEHPALSGKERQDVVAFIRSWQRIQIKF